MTPRSARGLPAASLRHCHGAPCSRPTTAHPTSHRRRRRAHRFSDRRSRRRRPASTAGDVGRSRVHRQPRRRRLLHPARSQRPPPTATRTSSASPRSASARCATRCCGRRPRPDGIAEADWSWADRRLPELRAPRHRADRRPGPSRQRPAPHRACSIPGFADGLAEFAAAVAARYPWVERLDARQRAADHGALQRPLRPLVSACPRRPLVRRAPCFNQCRATVLSMAAIRRVNPGARLIQTDDLGRTYGTEPLADVVDFYNERRWLGWDLLCGRVDRAPPALGLPRRERRRRGRHPLVRRPPLPARRHRRQLLRDQRALARPPARSLSRTLRRRARVPATSSTSSRSACWPRRRRRSRRCWARPGSATASRWR